MLENNTEITKKRTSGEKWNSFSQRVANLWTMGSAEVSRINEGALDLN